MKMTDEELAVWLGIKGTKEEAAIMASITPEQREAYEDFADKEMEIKLFVAGVGPRPPGVIICRGHKHHGDDDE
jgi:hypothetical protein